MEPVERREKFYTVAGVRWMRRSDHPYTALYPQLLVVELLLHEAVNGAAPLPPTAAEISTTYNAWLRQWNALLAANGATIPEIHQRKYKLFLQNVNYWMILMPKNIPITEFPVTLLRSWFNNVDLLLEVRCTGGAGTATSKFASLVVAKWHSGDGIDYFNCITEAREAKPATGGGSATDTKKRKRRDGGGTIFGGLSRHSRQHSTPALNSNV